MRMRSYRDLLVWQRAMALAKDVYAATADFPRSELFGLTSQMRRAAVSVPSNIAEGQGRSSEKHFLLFLGQARGSLFELQTQIQLAHEVKLLGQPNCEVLLGGSDEVARMLTGLMKRIGNK